MKRILIHLLALAWFVAGGIAFAADANDATNINSFDILSTRNIFDPSRTGPRRTIERPRPRQVDWFALVGTMSYEKGTFAFFDGNNSQYRKTLKASDTIAGYKIESITPDSIQLAAASNKVIVLPVGTQMRRYDGGRWAMAGAATPGPETGSSTEGMPASSSGSSSTSVSNNDQDSAASTGPESDVMKRLMLKRLQEK